IQTYALATRCALNVKGAEDMYTGQLKGMVQALDDPHSVLLEPEAVTALREGLAGEFFGVGLELEPIMNSGKFTGVRVVTPISDTPAERAGLKAKDTIFAVNDKKIFSYKNLDQVILDIKGKKGTPVTLTVLREGENKPFTVTIIRDKIVVKYVKTELLPNNWLWMKLAMFEGLGKFCPDIEKQYKDIEEKNAIKGVVLDLRNNPGGLLELAFCATSTFAPESLRGRWMLAEETRDGVMPIPSSGFGVGGGSMDIQKGKPLVVLVNGGSASASEIMAKVCQGFGFCVVVGDQSFGKGSVQQIFPIGDEKMAVKITISQYLVYDTSGALMPVQGVGVSPNIRLKVKAKGAAEEDFALRLRESDLSGSIPTSKNAKDIPPEKTKEANSKLYLEIVEALKAPQLKIGELE
ncbi:MAG: S41 family peptidase, partial [Patescibacteria group bacterium]